MYVLDMQYLQLFPAGDYRRLNTLSVSYVKHLIVKSESKDFENTFGLHFETLRVGGLVN